MLSKKSNQSSIFNIASDAEREADFKEACGVDAALPKLEPRAIVAGQSSVVSPVWKTVVRIQGARRSRLFYPCSIVLVICGLVASAAPAGIGEFEDKGRRTEQRTADRSSLPRPSPRVLESLFEDAILARNVTAVRQHASSLASDGERFEYLADWVLPAATHSNIRMSGVFTQTDPAPVTLNVELNGDREDAGLVSPVFDLLNTAKQSGRLDELQNRIAQLPQPGSERQQ
ncbi:MAG: hypothetical protein ABGZ53_27685 [Fuerstiella sp.]